MMTKDEFCDALTFRREIDGDGTIRQFNADGQLHREDGPAIEKADGTTIWFLNGQRHRSDGPAVVYANGSKLWYLNGKTVAPF